MKKLEDKLSDWLAYLVFEPIFTFFKYLFIAIATPVVLIAIALRMTWWLWVSIAALTIIF